MVILFLRVFVTNLYASYKRVNEDLHAGEMPHTQETYTQGSLQVIAYKAYQ